MKRHDFDRYDSPHWFVTHLPNYVRLEGIVGEPCKGGGNISNLLPYFDRVSHCWTNELDPDVDADLLFFIVVLSSLLSLVYHETPKYVIVE
ncbi:MAG: hypothetical protein ACKPKJ_16860 [Dolichospermum sp.]